MLPIDYLYSGARRWPDAIAAEDGETALTYRSLVESVEALACALQQLAPEPGRCVGICAPNTLEHLVSILAILAAGHVWIPLNPRNGKAETDAIIAATRPVLLIADATCLDRFTPTDARLVVSRPQATGPEPSVADLISKFLQKKLRPAKPALTATQAIKFTSGSTGKPKGVLQSYRSWNACAAGILDAFCFTEDERFLVAAPITHGTSCFVLPILSRGGRLILLERPKPPDILGAFARYGVTATFLTPTMIYMLMAEEAARSGTFPALRHLIYSGAPMRVQQIRAAQSVFGACLETCYGQAEAPQIISYMRASDFADDANLAAVGHSGLGTQIGIMDKDGGLLGRDEVGEIVVRGDLVMSGYLDNPKATAATIIDGWLHTGDLGLVDAQGLLFIKGRLREMIISGGFNIYPSDVEGALGTHPAVHECAVFGVDDPKWGEAVHAAVELNPGHSVGEKDLIGHVKALLDSVKAPKRVHIVTQLPRSPVGKVLRREAKAMVLRDLADAPRQA
jgi:acyl-CoA synthetase (AMP-forming)/AMP-acid ligase II